MKSLKSRNPGFINATTLILCVSVIVFLPLLAARQRVHPLLNVMDYYGYRELARSIFNRFDFTVRWELDAPFLYPPFFPILAHLLTFLTGDFVRSIQYISIFGASFCLVPLFLLVRKALNTHSAVLAVVFTTCYFGLKPCFDLRSDQFFCLLVITICWYVWTIMDDEDQRGWKYFVAGVLMSIAYLTKYSGILLCLAGAASIFFYFSRHKNGGKKAVGKVALLFAGAAPLLIGYQLAALNSSKNIPVLSISTYTFFDGNAVYEGGSQFREKRMRELDPAGKEFNCVSFLKKNTTSSFIAKNPAFILHKYIWGCERVIAVMASRVLPVADARDKRFVFGFQMAFVLLLVMGVYRCRSRPGLMHVLFFASMLAFFPIFHVADERYVMPLMPLYFVLWISGADAVYGLVGPWMKSRALRRSAGIAFFILLCCMYLTGGYRRAHRDYAIMSREGQSEEFRETAWWIGNDARDSVKRIKVMARYTAISYLADTEFVILPYTPDWNTIIAFAVSRNVDYVVVDKTYLSRNRPDQWSYFTKAKLPRAHVQMVHEFKMNNNTIWILKLASRARIDG